MMKLFDRSYPVTSLILLLTWGLFLALQLLHFGSATSSQAIFEIGGMFGRAVQYDPSQLWRLVSAIFVHIGWEHLILNSLSIYFLGRLIEGLCGSWRFALLYLLSGIMGNVFVLFWTPEVIAAGASTSLFGLFAGLSLLGKFAKSSYLRLLGQRYLPLLLLNLVFGFMSPGISQAGHVGGALGGGLATVFLLVSGQETNFTPFQKHLALVMYILMLIGLVSVRI